MKSFFDNLYKGSSFLLLCLGFFLLVCAACVAFVGSDMNLAPGYFRFALFCLISMHCYTLSVIFDLHSFVSEKLKTPDVTQMQDPGAGSDG